MGFALKKLVMSTIYKLFCKIIYSGSFWDCWVDALLFLQSTGSFFRDKSITLGNLIGISSILELSRRSTRGRISEPARSKKNYKARAWFLSLCSRLSTDAVSINNAPSLGQFLEVERRAASSYRRNPTSNALGPDDFSNLSDTNSLFRGGQVAPPQSSETALSRDLLIHENGDEPPLILSCLCGNLTRWSNSNFILFSVLAIFCGYDIWIPSASFEATLLPKVHTVSGWSCSHLSYLVQNEWSLHSIPRTHMNVITATCCSHLVI